MLRDMPRIIALMFISFFLVIMIAYYSKSNYTEDSSVKSMQDTLRVTAINNRDDSVRVTKGSFLLQKENFEKDFKKEFNESKNLNNETTDYKFSYLDDGKGGIKAIKVKVISGEKKYQATCALDVSE